MVGTFEIHARLLEGEAVLEEFSGASPHVNAQGIGLLDAHTLVIGGVHDPEPTFKVEYRVRRTDPQVPGQEKTAWYNYTTTSYFHGWENTNPGAIILNTAVDSDPHWESPMSNSVPGWSGVITHSKQTW